MFCSNCGNKLDDDAKYCVKCGKEIAPKEKITESSVESHQCVVTENTDNEVSTNFEDHPAGNFMWSYALGGPIIAWLCHCGETKKSEKAFFWPLFGWALLLNIPDRFFDRMEKLYESSAEIGVCSILEIIWYIVSIVLLGKIGASKMKECCPSYEKQSYKSHERTGIVVGIIFFVIAFAYYTIV